MKRATAVLALVAAVGVAPAVTAGASSSSKRPVRRTVKIGDNFFAPTKLTVPVNSTITWKWPSEVGDTHDVALRKGPKGFKKFESPIAASDFSFRRRLTKRGTYRIYCTLHEGMVQTITVR